jgi:hypothetical protein
MDYMYIFSKHDKWKRFDEFIFETHCCADKRERISLHQEHVFNISHLAKIIGKLEVYLKDRKDVEQAYYACKWFETEFEKLRYSLSYFRRWLAQKKEIEAPF